MVAYVGAAFWFCGCFASWRRRVSVVLLVNYTDFRRFDFPVSEIFNVLSLSIPVFVCLLVSVSWFFSFKVVGFIVS